MGLTRPLRLFILGGVGLLGGDGLLGGVGLLGGDGLLGGVGLLGGDGPLGVGVELLGIIRPP